MYKLVTDGNEILMCRINYQDPKTGSQAVQFYQLLLKLVSYSAPYLYFTCLTPDDFTVGIRDRGQLPPNFGKPWKFGQMLGKIKKIRADLSENRLNSGNFITILHKNSVKF
jgi:hypothetical protein